MAKSIILKPFAPKGLLSDLQMKRLVAWYGGQDRLIKQTEIAELIGASRSAIHKNIKKYPERPFDELKLRQLNKLIQIYNQDIQKRKENEREKAKLDKQVEKKKAEKRVEKLIEKASK